MKYKLLKKTAHLDKGEVIDEEFLPFGHGTIIFQLLLDLGYMEEYEPNNKWEPKSGEEYYFVNDDGEVGDTYYYTTYSSDTGRKEIGNCFQTREEAKVLAEKFKALLKQERGTTTY